MPQRNLESEGGKKYSGNAVEEVLVFFSVVRHTQTIFLSVPSSVGNCFALSEVNGKWWQMMNSLAPLRQWWLHKVFWVHSSIVRFLSNCVMQAGQALAWFRNWGAEEVFVRRVCSPCSGLPSPCGILFILRSAAPHPQNFGAQELSGTVRAFTGIFGQPDAGCQMHHGISWWTQWALGNSWFWVYGFSQTQIRTIQNTELRLYWMHKMWRWKL